MSFLWSVGSIHVGHEGCGTQSGNIKVRYPRYLSIKMLGVNNRGSGTGYVQCLKAGKETEVLKQFDGRAGNDTKSSML